MFIFSPQESSKDEITSYRAEYNIRPKNVVLVASPWIFQEYVEFKSQNLGLSYIGGFIQDCGHNVVSYIDPLLYGGDKIKEKIDSVQNVYRFGHSDDWIVSRIPSFVDYILINAPFTDSRFVLYPLIKRMKEFFPNCKIVVGGVLSTSLPEEVVMYGMADISVIGEGEIACARILNEEDLSTIKGIVYRDDSGSVVNKNAHAEQFEDINNLSSIFKYNFLPIENYIEWSPRGNKKDRTLSYITSRGCPFCCNFCSVPENGQLWRNFSPSRVIDDFNFAIDRYGVNSIEIEDDNFTFDPIPSRHILRYISELRYRGTDICLSFPNGVMIHKLEEEDIRLFKGAGVKIVYLPVESGDLKNLILMNKPFLKSHIEKSLQVAEWCKKYDILSGAFFILGYPGGTITRKSHIDIIKSDFNDSIFGQDEDGIFVRGEDEKSFNITLDFMKKMKHAGVSFITPLVATPYPSTNLFSECKKFNWLRYGENDRFVFTVSYQDFRKEFININTPWCSYDEIYNRWKRVESEFSIKHNVIQ